LATNAVAIIPPAGPGHLRWADDAAVRLHHHDVVGEAAGAQLAVQPGHVAVDRAPEEAVRDRGVGTRILAHLRRDLVRQRQRQIGIEGTKNLGRARLVRRVPPAEQEREGDRLDALFFHQNAGGLANPRLVERHDDRAAVVDALVDAFDRLPRHQRLRLGHVGDVLDFHLVEPVDAADGAHHVDRILEAARRDQPDLGTAAIDQRVGRDRRAVLEHARTLEELARAQAQRLGCHLDRVDHALREILRRRRRFVDRHSPIGMQHDDVREGAARIDTDDEPVFPGLGFGRLDSGLTRQRHVGHLPSFSALFRHLRRPSEIVFHFGF
jgi:hypothetical protein